MKNFIKIIGATLLLLMLSGCLGIGGSTSTTGPTTVTDPNFTSYAGPGFTIAYPNGWEVLERPTFTSNVPAETIVDFRNNIKNEIFTANVNVSSTQVPQTVTAEDLGKSSIVKNKEGLVAYNETGKQDFTYKIGELDVKTFIQDFEGKKTPAESIIHFKQLYIVNNGVGYTITASYLPNEDESVVKAVEEMLNSFLLK